MPVHVEVREVPAGALSPHLIGLSVGNGQGITWWGTPNLADLLQSLVRVECMLRDWSAKSSPTVNGRAAGAI